MLFTRLLFGAGLASLLLGGFALVGLPMGIAAILSALGLLALPTVVARLLDAPEEMDDPEPARRGPRDTWSLLSNVAFLGVEGRPYAFPTLPQARRFAQGHYRTFGIVACDGVYLLVDRHLQDRDLARAHIRATYAPWAGAAGLPLEPIGFALDTAATPLALRDRLDQTRDALRSATSFDRLARTASDDGTTLGAT
jgi:hypothetical protein